METYVYRYLLNHTSLAPSQEIVSMLRTTLYGKNSDRTGPKLVKVLQNFG